MKRLITAVATLAAVSGSAPGFAFAADMAASAYRAPPPVPPAYNWTGFYLGAGFGYGLFDAETTPVDDVTGGALTSTIDNAGRGWHGRFVVGYDYQINSSVVVGAFTNFDPSNIKGTMATGVAVATEPLGGDQKESWAWDVGARAGWLLMPSILTYFDGGFSRARFDAVNVHNLTTGDFIGTLPARTFDGWFLGSGFVTPLPFFQVPGLFLDTEYRLSSYRGITKPLAVIGGVPTDISMRPTVQTVTTALVYKFNWTGH
jgi:outer membrane immunogenic protein